MIHEALRLTVDKKEIKDFLKLPLATSSIHKPLGESAKEEMALDESC